MVEWCRERWSGAGNGGVGTNSAPSHYQHCVIV